MQALHRMLSASPPPPAATSAEGTLAGLGPLGFDFFLAPDTQDGVDREFAALEKKITHLERVVGIHEPAYSSSRRGASILATLTHLASQAEVSLSPSCPLLHLLCCSTLRLSAPVESLSHACGASVWVGGWLVGCHHRWNQKKYMSPARCTPHRSPRVGHLGVQILDGDRLLELSTQAQKLSADIQEIKKEQESLPLRSGPLSTAEEHKVRLGWSSIWLRRSSLGGERHSECGLSCAMHVVFRVVHTGCELGPRSIRFSRPWRHGSMSLQNCPWWWIDWPLSRHCTTAPWEQSKGRRRWHGNRLPFRTVCSQMRLSSSR